MILSAITPAGTIAPTLFEDPDKRRLDIVRSRRLMDAVDRLNHGSGPNVLKLATELTMGHIGHNDGYSSSFGPAKKY